MSIRVTMCGCWSLWSRLSSWVTLSLLISFLLTCFTATARLVPRWSQRLTTEKRPLTRRRHSRSVYFIVFCCRSFYILNSHSVSVTFPVQPPQCSETQSYPSSSLGPRQWTRLRHMKAGGGSIKSAVTLIAYVSRLSLRSPNTLRLADDVTLPSSLVATHM